MTRRESIEHYLCNNYEEEITIIGKESVYIVINNALSVEEYEKFDSIHGSNLDVTSIISLLGSVVGIIDVVLEVIENGDEKKNKQEVLDEVRNRISDAGEYIIDVFILEQNRLSKIICDMINNEFD